MTETPTMKVLLDVPIDVHYAFKLAKKRTGDERSLNEIYVEIIINQSKKIKS